MQSAGVGVAAQVPARQNAPSRDLLIDMSEIVLRGCAGRPVDVQQARDNSLLVSDDKAGVVYRISYNSSFDAAAAAAAAAPASRVYEGPA